MAGASQCYEKHIMSNTACRILERIKGRHLKTVFFFKVVSLACEPGLKDKRFLDHRLEPAFCVYWKLVFLKVRKLIFKELDSCSNLPCLDFVSLLLADYALILKW